MEILTKKQDQVLCLLKEYTQQYKKAPSLSELQELSKQQGLPMKSKRSVVQYLDALTQKGYITRSSEERSIALVSAMESDAFIDIPIMGTANAGKALVFAEENIRGFIKASKKLLTSTQNIFALQIAGDSMNKSTIDNKFIEDGDYVVIDKNAQSIQNNEIILAIIEGCATIKRLKKTMFGELLLLPDSSNPIHQPIYIHESDSFFINGRVINVLKAAKNL